MNQTASTRSAAFKLNAASVAALTIAFEFRKTVAELRRETVSARASS
jgi:hypothetical protein